MNPIKFFWSLYQPGGMFCPGVAAAVIGAGVIGAAGTAYSADQSRKASNKANDAASAAARQALLPISTGASYVNRGAGIATIDPTIRGLREQTLGNLPGYRQNLNNAYSNFSGQLGGLYGQLQGNQNALVKAAQDPLRQSQAQQAGALQMDLGQRGLSGSSFGNAALTNLNTDYGTAIGNSGANALQSSLGAQLGVAGQQFGAAQSANQGGLVLDQQQQGVAGQNLAQELSALGLTQADIGSILNAGALGASATNAYAQNIGRGVGSLGQLATGLSRYYRPNQSLGDPNNQVSSGWTSDQANYYDGGLN